MSLHRNNVVILSRRNNDVIIDLIHKSHNAQVRHPTMHHFVTEMCTCMHFSVAKCCIVRHLSNALWDIYLMHCGICEMGLLRFVSTGTEVPCHLGHGYIISNTLYTGCAVVVVGST